jgi:hypothetical protein
VAKFKTPSDPRGGHIRIYHAMLDSPAWKALSFADRGLYLELRRQLKSFNNGDINAAMGTMKHVGVKSPTTLAKGLRALMAVGLLARTRDGGIAHGEKFCTLYRFTDEATFDHPKLGIVAGPASNEWKRFTSIGEAKAAIKAASAPVPSSVKKQYRKNATRIQFLERQATDSVASDRFLATDSVVVPPMTATDSVSVKKAGTRRKAAPVLAVPSI